MKRLAIFFVACVACGSVFAKTDAQPVYPACMQAKQAVIDSSKARFPWQRRAVDSKKAEAFDACQQRESSKEMHAYEDKKETQQDPIQAILDEHWEQVAASGAQIYYYNNRNVTRDISGTHVALKTSTLGPDGQVSTIAISEGSFACRPGSAIPHVFLRESGFTIEKTSGDRFSLAPGGMGEIGEPLVPVNIEYGSPLAVVVKAVCS